MHAGRDGRAPARRPVPVERDDPVRLLQRDDEPVADDAVVTRVTPGQRVGRVVARGAVRGEREPRDRACAAAADQQPVARPLGRARGPTRPPGRRRRRGPAGRSRRRGPSAARAGAFRRARPTRRSPPSAENAACRGPVPGGRVAAAPSRTRRREARSTANRQTVSPPRSVTSSQRPSGDGSDWCAGALLPVPVRPEPVSEDLGGSAERRAPSSAT